MTYIVNAKPFKSNTSHKQSFRVIGTVDIDGKGVTHLVHDVDPFIFLDETILSGQEPWPFPKHPHSGLVAIAYLLEGEMIPWDNRNGKSEFNNQAQGLYWIASNQGILHEEEPIYHQGNLRWLQLWVNPGLETAYQSIPTTGLIKPEVVPMIHDDIGVIRVLLGSFADIAVKSPFAWPITYLHLKINPGRRRMIDQIDPSWQAFIYVLHGVGKIDSEAVSLRDCAVLDNATYHTIENNSNDILEVIFAAGKPHLQPFYKLLGGGGAFIAASEDEARKVLAKFNEAGERFGLD